mgnify:CR=1 FL=1
MVHKVIIIGSGPAGLTAAIYAARAKMEPVLFEGATPGGPLMITTEVENFPGFPEGIQGPDLIMAMKKQSERFGTKTITKNVTDIKIDKRPFRVYTGDEEEYQTESLIIATGTEPRKLGLESEKKLTGRGISYCATCDGPLFKDKKVIVVGGGDSAMEESLFLSKFATEVVVVVRKDALKASEIMVERAKKNPKIKWLMNTEIKEFIGEQKLEKVKLFNNKTNEESEMEAQGVFLAIGRIPNTKMFEGKLKMDKGYIVTECDSAKTSVPGVFAAGDVSEWHYWQAATAAGKGCMAAKDAERFLADSE